MKLAFSIVGGATLVALAAGSMLNLY